MIITYLILTDAMSRPDKIILDETECKGTTNDRRKCRMPPCEVHICFNLETKVVYIYIILLQLWYLKFTA